VSERPPGPSSVGGTPVIVRAATRADVEAIQAIYLPIVKDTAVSFEELPPDSAEIARRMLAKPYFHGSSPITRAT
jgi:phosphinothricin acetyltransferase